MQKDLNNHSINDLTLLKRKEKCKPLHDEHLARTQQDYRTILRSQQVRQRKEPQFEGIEEFDYAVDLKQAGGSTKSRGEICRQLCCRRQTGIKPTGRRAIGILSILQGLTIFEFFLRVRTSFGCLEKKPPDNRRGV